MARMEVREVSCHGKRLGVCIGLPVEVLLFRPPRKNAAVQPEGLREALQGRKRSCQVKPEGFVSGEGFPYARVTVVTGESQLPVLVAYALTTVPAAITSDWVPVFLVPE